MRREGQAGRPVAGRSPRTKRDGARSRTRGALRAECGRRRVHSLMTGFGLENCSSSVLDASAKMKQRRRARERGKEAEMPYPGPSPLSLSFLSSLELLSFCPGPSSLPQPSFDSWSLIRSALHHTRAPLHHLERSARTCARGVAGLLFFKRPAGV
jgi:hypothetical protein